jgi:pimeloyl-ACP methyl ester carboxylesterase
VSETFQAPPACRLSVGGIELAAVRRGVGRPVVLLHGLDTIDPRASFLNLLSARAAVIAPSHPGFGTSARPDGFETVYDLAHLYLEMLESLPYDKVTLGGFSFGGWLAAEIAVSCCHRIEKLVLVDALGIKISNRETADILDIFNTSPAEVRRQRWHDPNRFAPDYDAMSDEELTIVARNWDALSLYGWQPYMYNPRLSAWLGRIRVPTLVLWGEQDGIVAPAYGGAYAALIPGARFVTVPRAGHHPEIEQPEAFARHLLAFLGA